MRLRKTSLKKDEASDFAVDGVGDFAIFENDGDGRLDAISARSSSADYQEVFLAMGASRVERFDNTSRNGSWCFLVKLRRQWRLASQTKDLDGISGDVTWIYSISQDEVFYDQVGGECKVEVLAVLRERDPDYFFTRGD